MGSDVAALHPFGSGGETKSSFDFSFSFLPREQREALKTVYAFCRTTDNIVDNAGDVESNLHRLQRWRKELEKALAGKSDYSLLNQLSSVAKRFHIPVEHFYELMRGVEMDLTTNRYETFEQLKEYCYLVASTVGLMSLGIFAPRNERTKEYAINLGIALQLTNILRDVGMDAQYGRIYLPQEDLRRFGYSEHDLFARRYSPEFQSLMEFEAKRAEEFFQKAKISLPPEDKRAMFAAKIMERIYFHTLQKIREARFNVFDNSIRIPRSIQFLIAVKYWVKQRLFGL
ncbi:MAG: presqualene diphosphate synthase HpnD [Ignavibacteriae bacterium]|nr:presqualene diphosphate synthase HpnD [Ignavibacteria bacterium]MBI3364809.1 presqualene diphosphate synthase HpnD [Ignavibacteriota bacterium]